MREEKDVVSEKKESYFMGRAGRVITVTAVVGFSLLGPGVNQAQASDEPAYDEPTAKEQVSTAPNAVLSDDDDGLNSAMLGEWICEDYTTCVGKYVPCATGIKPCEIKYEHCSNIGVE